VNFPVLVGTSWYSRSPVLCLQIVSTILGIPGRSSRESPPSSIRQRQWTVPTLYSWKSNFYVASAWWLFECRNRCSELDTAYCPEVHMGVISSSIRNQLEPETAGISHEFQHRGLMRLISIIYLQSASPNLDKRIWRIWRKDEDWHYWIGLIQTVAVSCSVIGWWVKWSIIMERFKMTRFGIAGINIVPYIRIQFYSYVGASRLKYPRLCGSSWTMLSIGENRKTILPKIYWRIWIHQHHYLKILIRRMNDNFIETQKRVMRLEKRQYRLSAWFSLLS